MTSPAITRVRVRNFKSIKACDVELGRLAILVGPNGSGKSNFLDSLRFTADALTTTLDHAIRDRGGINEVRRRSGGHPNHFAVRLDLRVPSGRVGHFSYRVGAQPDGGYRVTDEECVLRPKAVGDSEARYRTKLGEMSTTADVRLPNPSPDRLFLVSASSVEPFREVFDVLTSMGFYNLSPAAIRTPQPPDPGALLRRDGGNLAAVLAHLKANRPDLHERAIEYLRKVAPGIEDAERLPVGSMETIQFRQRVAGQSAAWKFDATNMSDGTLRALGVLVAMLQANGRPPSLVGIEEPEVALHPGAVDVLIDAISDATQQTQLVVTSHSPELLDREDLDPNVLLAVDARDGVTTIGSIDEAGASALRDRLFTAGEMLRLNRLDPTPEARDLTERQLRLFED